MAGSQEKAKPMAWGHRRGLQWGLRPGKQGQNVLLAYLQLSSHSFPRCFPKCPNMLAGEASLMIRKIQDIYKKDKIKYPMLSIWYSPWLATCEWIWLSGQSAPNKRHDRQARVCPGDVVKCQGWETQRQVIFAFQKADKQEEEEDEKERGKSCPEHAKMLHRWICCTADTLTHNKPEFINTKYLRSACNWSKKAIMIHHVDGEYKAIKTWITHTIYCVNAQLTITSVVQCIQMGTVQCFLIKQGKI